MSDYSQLIHTLRTEPTDYDTDREAADAIEAQSNKIKDLKIELNKAYEKIEELNAQITDMESELTVSYMFGYDRGKEDARKGLGDA